MLWGSYTIGAKEIGVIDRRSINEQQRNVFVVGELVEIPPIE